MSAESVAVVDAWAALAFLQRDGAADIAMRRYQLSQVNRTKGAGPSDAWRTR